MSTNSGTSSETGALTVRDAATALESLIDDSGAMPTTVKKAAPVRAAPDAEEDEDEDVVAPEGDDAVEEEEEGASEEGDESPDEDANEESPDEGEPDEEDEQETNEPDDSSLITVKVDGKTERVTLEELRKGYSRTKDYTQKTMELADRRKAIDSESVTVQQEREQLAAITTALQERLTQNDAEPDWDALRAEDPVEWSIQKNIWIEKREERARLANVTAELARRNAADRQKQHEGQLAQERDALLEKAPEWKSNPTKAEKELAEIRQYALSVGFTEEEASQVYDHRAVLALRDAMRFQKLMKKQTELSEKGSKVTVTKRGPKPLTPGGAGGEKPGRVQARRESLAAHAKTGSVDSAAKALMNIPGLL